VPDLTATARLAPAGSVSWFTDLVRAEWIKFRSTRSACYGLLAAATAALLVGLLAAQSVGSRWTHLSLAKRAGLDPLAIAFRGFDLAQLIIGTLGVLLITSEYSTGLIRTTFSAVPQRRAVLAAKAVVAGTVALVTGEALSFAVFFPAQALLHSTGISVSITSPGAPRAVVAMGLYLAVVAVLGVGLGALIRHTAGAIAALLGLIFLVPGIVSALPAPWDNRIGKWLPQDLIGQLTSVHLQPGELSRPASLAMLLAYPAAFLGAAAWRLRHRDA
jgi:ABC-2 type transport system permease protein